MKSFVNTKGVYKLLKIKSEQKENKKQTKENKPYETIG